MIRPLGPDDLDAYRALWLDGLRRVPEAFLFTEVEALGLSDASLIAKLAAGQFWGGFSGDILVALIAMHQGGPERMRHMADIGPLYVHPSTQGQGYAKRLLQAVEQAARDRGLLQLELCVDATNAHAIGLYRAAGFVEFGKRPRSVIVNGAARDDLLMIKMLDAT